MLPYIGGTNVTVDPVSNVNEGKLWEGLSQEHSEMSWHRVRTVASARGM